MSCKFRTLKRFASSAATTARKSNSTRVTHWRTLKTTWHVPYCACISAQSATRLATRRTRSSTAHTLKRTAPTSSYSRTRTRCLRLPLISSTRWPRLLATAAADRRDQTDRRLMSASMALLLRLLRPFPHLILPRQSLRSLLLASDKVFTL